METGKETATATQETPKTHYKGKPTKARQRLERLEAKKNYHDERRWIMLPKAVIKSMAANGFEDFKELF